MKATTHTFGGVTSTVYQMNAGEKVDRHRHIDISHTTGVIAGRSEVEIWEDTGESQQIFQMEPGQIDYILPPNIDHEVRSIVDGTIVIHMVMGSYSGDITVTTTGT